MEEWKDIEGYFGLYQVSNMGRVKSLERTVRYNGGYYKKSERILKAHDNGHGYLHVGLCKDGKVKNCYVHRLVADAFCENPMGYNEVNHKDENKLNNKADNLEFCSHSYNNTYNDKAKKVGKKLAEKLINNPKLSKPVIAIHKINGLILEFPSVSEASRVTGTNLSNISQCCQGKMKSAGGYYWHYADSEEVM